MASRENDSKKDFFERYTAGIRVVENMRTYEDDPVFKKKLEDAYKALEECPLPEHLIKRLNEG